MKLTEKQDRLFEFVKERHGVQVRKYTGKPYWTHLISVAEIVSDYNSNVGVEIALCHDLLEDTSCESGQLHQLLEFIGYNNTDRLTIVSGVHDLTDEFTSEKYPNFNRKQRKEKEAERLVEISPNSQTVKYADIIDNTSSIVEYDPGFARVYLKEIQNKIYKMDKGDPDLYERCIETVEHACFILGMSENK